jgi:hypothetical protein
MLFRETVAVGPQILYKDPDRTSQETHCISATKPSLLMLFRERVAVYCGEAYETYKYTPWAECRVENVKAGGTCS